MKLNIDDRLLSIPCPKCSEKISETVGRFKANPHLTCPACNATVRVDAEKLREGAQALQKSLDDFRRKMKDTLKGR